MMLGMFSSASSLNLLSSGSMTDPRSGLSSCLSSAHRRANLVNFMASLMGQSGTSGSSISAKVPVSMALST
ncbi:hypothetical protein POPTR_018G146966v4 [Populus trichocarpa]|uniref:Uncharacterized protein n=1 Tax=Populus trichocarpa TaxID=3694 RepID=A0ACC0RNP7_POPTR|nr:hypothetical protein POPTR_018G146966v4 [Populus trichocarpa]